MLHIILAAGCYAAFQVFASLAATRLSNSWFIALGAISVAVFTSLILVFRQYSGVEFGKITFFGAVFIIIANLGIALFTMYLGKAFQFNSPAFFIPLVFGGARFISTTASYFLEKRVPATIEVIGLFCIVIGLMLVSYQYSK